MHRSYFDIVSFKGQLWYHIAALDLSFIQPIS